MIATLERPATLSSTSTPSYAQALAALPSVGLADLTARAERLTRIDRKYVVPRDLLSELVCGVADVASVLEIGGRREFGYRSVYLDTDDLLCFRSAGQSRRRRFKVRTRTYLDSGDSFLEVKTTGARGATVKNRVAWVGSDSAPLARGGDRFVAAELASAGVTSAPVGELAPRLVTAYRRTTLLLPGASGGSADSQDAEGDRVTIDTNLAWSTVDGAPRDLDRPALAIVETKAGSTPTAMDRLLWRLGHRPTRLSKYGTGMAAIRPDLPHLKWHRTLTTQLSPRSYR